MGNLSVLFTTYNLEAVKDVDCLICHSTDYFMKDPKDGKAKGGARVVVTVNAASYRSVNVYEFVYQQPEYGQTFTQYTVHFDKFDQSVRETYVLNSIKALVKKPTPDGCKVCHNFSAGGPYFKRGFNADADVHMDSVGTKVYCIDCHTPLQYAYLTQPLSGQTGKHYAGAHEFSIGKMPDLFTNENSAKQCTECHIGNIHANAILNDHYRRIDCRVCHIPQNLGLRLRDYTTPVLDSAYTGNWQAKDYVRNTGLPPYVVAEKESAGLPYYIFKPVDYQHDHRHGIKPTYSEANKPGNLNAKLMTFNEMTVKGYFDPRNGKIIPLQLKPWFTSSNGDTTIAVYNGAKDWGSKKITMKLYDTFLFTGSETSNNMSWTISTSTSYFQMDHTIKPASQALSCVDCHTASGKVASATNNWRSTGYSAARSKLLIFSQK